MFPNWENHYGQSCVLIGSQRKGLAGTQRLKFQRITAQQTQVQLRLKLGSVHGLNCSNIELGAGLTWALLSVPVCLEGRGLRSASGDSASGKIHVHRMTKNSPSGKQTEDIWFGQQKQPKFLMMSFLYRSTCYLLWSRNYCTLYKKVIVFPVPSRDATNQTLPGWEFLNYSRRGRVWLVTSRLGTGKTITFFYNVLFTVQALPAAQSTCQHLGYSQSRSRPSKLCLVTKAKAWLTKALLFSGEFTSLLYFPPCKKKSSSGMTC